MSRHARFLLVFLAIAAMRGQTFPPQVNFSQSIPFLGSGGTQRLFTASDTRGGYYWVGSLQAPLTVPVTATITGGSLGGQDIFVAKFDTVSHQVVYTTVIGGAQEDIPVDAHADEQGNLYIAGTTASSDFPGVTLPSGAKFTGFVVKLNFSGKGLDSVATLPDKVIPVSIDVDGAGRIFVAGRANVLALPTSPGVLVPSPITNVHPDDSQPFLLKLNGAGTGIEWATFLTRPSDQVRKLSVRPNGEFVLLTLQALERVNASGSAVLSTLPLDLADRDLKFDVANNMFLTGTQGYPVPTAFVRKLAPDGTTVIWTKAVGFGGNLELAISLSGRVHVFVHSAYPNFPTRNSVQSCGGSGALVVLDSEGTILNASFFNSPAYNPVVAPLGIYMTTVQTIPNSSGFFFGIVRVAPDFIPADHLSPACLVHGATYDISAVAPGLIATIYGSYMGPETGVSAQLENGRIPFSVAGVSLTVDGRPAPILYVRQDQINFIVPWATRTDHILILVCVKKGAEESCIPADTAKVAAGLFPYAGMTAALNQDMTVNSEQNPAKSGSYVSVFLTGLPVEGAVVDGGVGGFPLQHTPLSATAAFSPNTRCFSSTFGCMDPPPFPAEVSYSGTAPQLALGVTQVNLRVPDQVAPGVRGFSLVYPNVGVMYGSINIGPK